MPPPLRDLPEPVEDGEDRSPAMTFFEHLGELRKALVHAALAYVIGLAIAFPLAPRIFQLLQGPLVKAGKDPHTFLIAANVTGGLQLAMSTSLWSALVFALPFMVVSIAGFIFPGLTRRERRVIVGSLAYAAVLFVAGVALGFWMLPAALRIMLWFPEWMGAAMPFWFAPDYIRFVLLVLASFGVTFELPIGVMILGRLGLVTSAQLREKRRHALVFILILAAFVTPTTDPFSLFVLALPLALLYEVGIWTTWSAERRATPE